MHFMTTNKVQNILSVFSDFHSSQLVTGFQKNAQAWLMSGSRNTEKFLKKITWKIASSSVHFEVWCMTWKYLGDLGCFLGGTVLPFINEVAGKYAALNVVLWHECFVACLYIYEFASYMKLIYLYAVGKALATNFDDGQLFHLRRWFLMCGLF